MGYLQTRERLGIRIDNLRVGGLFHVVEFLAAELGPASLCMGLCSLRMVEFHGLHLESETSAAVVQSQNVGLGANVRVTWSLYVPSSNMSSENAASIARPKRWTGVPGPLRRH